ncbi:hypothetical protein CCHR01_09442 [Colletotrichum chrysophilum]|uniref:Uncharacterized protein n=1 Tax=Colletotrichum chrysophilum TaxID=1836956 RepID=A0AAD9EKH8_9PEZI|nr:hypothetical protein CCHR01_09442 [Colletotrichum chrysophilum]
MRERLPPPRTGPRPSLSLPVPNDGDSGRLGRTRRTVCVVEGRARDTLPGWEIQRQRFLC